MQRFLLSIIVVAFIGGLAWWQRGTLTDVPILQSKAYQAPSTGEMFRLAVVIGNGSGYQGGGFRPLLTPENDAEEMAKTLNKLGFQVIKETNADKATIETRVREMTDALKAQGGGVGLFYFSGHGVGLKRSKRNFLIPVKARIGEETDVPYQAVEANWVVERMQNTNPTGVNLVFLDACRSYDVPSLTMNHNNGLAEMPNPQGTLIAYATAPGKVAYTSPREHHSVFTDNLLKLLKDDNKARSSVASLMIDLTAMTEPHSVRLIEQVRQLSPQDAEGLEPQTPWVAMSLKRHFCFREPCLVAVDDSGQRQMLDMMKQMQEEQAKMREEVRQLREDRQQRDAISSRDGISTATQTATATQRDAISSRDGISTPSGDFRDCADCPLMVKIPGTSMAMGKYEVTRGEFSAFVTATSYKTEAEKGDGCYGWTGSGWKQDKKYTWRNLGFTQTDSHPVACVSWHDAVAYTNWLSSETGKTYRLPTEQEWERAARGGTTTQYWWGDDASHDYANYGNDKCCGPLKQGKDEWDFTAPVNTMSANPFGLHHVLGNVWEWTCGAYETDKNGTDGCISKNHANKDADRVFRGGSWYFDAEWLAASFRFNGGPGYRYYYALGLRVARMF